MTKACTRCGLVLDFSAFGVKKRNSDGLQRECRACLNSENRSYRNENAEQVRAWDRKRNAERSAIRAPQRAEYRRLNAATIKPRDAALSRARRAAGLASRDPATRAANQAKREAAKLKATPPWADPKAIARIYAECRAITAITGIPHHVDHVVPLRGALVCGLHIAINLQVITAADNIRKRNHFAAG